MVLGGLVNRLRRTMGRRKQSWVLLGSPWELSSGAWGSLGPLREETGQKDGLLGAPGESLGAPWELLGAPWCPLGASR
jgi:hypothetical protein